MPGPVRYTESGKVKKSAPRKYESGKGWSKLTPKEQAAPSVAPSKTTSRKSRVRRAVAAPRSRGDFGRRFARLPRTTTSAVEKKQTGSEPIRPSLLPRKEVVAAVLDALSQPVDLPGTRFDKLGEMLSFLTPRGVVKGATVRGVSGLRAAMPARATARVTVARRAAKAAAKETRQKTRSARRTAARRRRRSKRTDAQGRYEVGMEDRADPPWVGKSELRGRIDEMKSLRGRK